MATPLPLNGAPLVLTFPEGGGQPQITLQGHISDAYDGSIYDGHDADEGGSILQISPGQWTLSEADAPSHTYTFVPLGEVTNLSQVSVQFDASQLIDAHLISPREVQANLSGTIEVTTAAPPPPMAVSPLAWIGAVAALTAFVMVSAQLRAMQKRTQGTRALWSRCQAAAKKLEAQLKAEASLSDTARGELLASLKSLMVEAKALKERIPQADAKLRPYMGQLPEDPTLRQEVEHLQADKARSTEALRSIASTLEAQSLSLARSKEAGPSTQGAEAVQKRLEAIRVETSAALQAKAELESLR